VLQWRQGTDVTEHLILRICRDWLAMNYILENDLPYQDLLTEKNEEGEGASFALMPQRSREDLLRLREIVKLWARVFWTSRGEPRHT
jgi:4-hydroxybutyryl-CoA dehydratase/vinylacetyl-CoA-Delta-isomerase